MLTGDSEDVATSVAGDVGIKEYKAELLVTYSHHLAV